MKRMEHQLDRFFRFQGLGITLYGLTGLMIIFIPGFLAWLSGSDTGWAMSRPQTMFFSFFFALGCLVIWLAAGSLASYAREQNNPSRFRTIAIRLLYAKRIGAFLPMFLIFAIFLVLVSGEPLWTAIASWTAALQASGWPAISWLQPSDEIVHSTQTLAKIIWLLPIVGLGFLQQALAELAGVKRHFNEEVKVPSLSQVTVGSPKVTHCPRRKFAIADLRRTGRQLVRRGQSELSSKIGERLV